jgi:hypothetical protein
MITINFKTVKRQLILKQSNVNYLMTEGVPNNPGNEEDNATSFLYEI